MGPRGHQESGMTERLHFHFIHELFPLIDGLSQPGEFTKLTVDSQDPLPQCHFLHFRKDCLEGPQEGTLAHFVLFLSSVL